MKSSVLKLVLVLLLLVPTVSAAWTIQDVDSPYSMQEVDIGSDTVQIIRVLDSDGDPVDPERMDTTAWELGLYYNMTHSGYYTDEPYDMDYMGNGYWYSQFNVTEDDDYEVKYELSDDSPEGGEINETETLNVGTLSIDMLTDLKDRYKAGREIFMRVNATGTSTTDREVVAFFSDGEQRYSFTELGQNEEGLYTNIVPVPEEYNKTFALYASVDNSQNNEFAVEGTVIDTYPAELGRYEYLEASGSGCNNESFFEACERGTNIDVGFNATIFPAESSRFEVFLEREEGFWEQVEETSMDKADGLWEASFEFPDVNTSVYTDNVIMRVNSSIDGSYYYLDRNTTSESFKIRDSSDPTTYPGQSYPVELAFVKHFSLEPLNDTRIKEASAEIKYPNGTVLENLSLSDFNYSTTEGVFHADVDIPADAEEGNYPVDIQAKNIHGESKQSESGFNVKDIQVSFNAVDDISIEARQSGVHTEEIILESRVGEDRTLNWSLGGDIVNITTVNNNESIDLPASQSKTVPVEFDLDALEDYEGNITFSDPKASYNDTVDVEINIPECKLRSGDLCLLEGEWLNMTGLEVGHEVVNVTLLNLGQSEKLVNVHVEGEVAQYLNIRPTEFNLQESQPVTFNYSVVDEGDFTGVVIFKASADTIELGTKLSSKADRQDPSIKTPESIDMGTVLSGDTIERDIYVHNDGDLNVESLSAMSQHFDAHLINPENLGVTDNKTFTLELRSVTSGYGTVKISGDTSKGQVNSTITVTGELEPRRDTSELERRINDLREQVDSTSDKGRLDTLESRISNIEEDYENGNGESANEEYSEVSSELSELESQFSSSNTDPGQSQDSSDQTGEEGGSGMEGMLVPVAVVVFVLVLIGFVFYTSYVPEEGDPLYDLMGQ